MLNCTLLLLVRTILGRYWKRAIVGKGKKRFCSIDGSTCKHNRQPPITTIDNKIILCDMFPG